MLASPLIFIDHIAMAERVRVPGVRGITDEMSESIIDALVADGRLPRDFDFRLHAIADDDRARVAREDVLAALGYGKGSREAYLTDDLPDCVKVAGFGGLLPILSGLDEDYYALSDMERVARSEEVEKHVARGAWTIYTEHFNPDLMLPIKKFLLTQKGWAEPGLSKRRQHAFFLSRIAIRDSALHEIYASNIKLPNHGSVMRRLLHGLLLDNHPELGEK